MVDAHLAGGDGQPAGAGHGKEGSQIVPIEARHVGFCTKVL